MEEVKKPSKRKKGLLRILLLIVCGVILGVNIYQLNAKSLVGDQLPMPFGQGAAIVLSGSMEPELSKGDLIFVKKITSIEQLALRDVVVYQDDGMLVVHRIVDMQGDTIITQGDANNVTDDPITIAEIKGKVTAHVPFVGTIVSGIKTPVGTVCIIIVAIALVEIPRRREKQRDDEKRQKIIDEIKRLKDEV